MQERGGERLLLQCKVKLRSEPEGAQNTQGVLFKAGGRLPHRADYTRLQVMLPAEQIA